MSLATVGAEPPPYPRVPHLVEGCGTSDDVTLDPASVRALLSRPVLVEEKLDGANVVLWLVEGVVKCALRSGAAGMDRARQLGPLRAWIGEHHDRLVEVLAGVRAVYTEWLLLTHTVHYDRLSDYVVVLDVLRADGAFAGVDERDAVATALGLPVAPVLHRGVVAGGLDGLNRLAGVSTFADLAMEGLVVRTLDGSAPRVAKLVRRGFVAIDSDEWRAGRPRNELAESGRSWH